LGLLIDAVKSSGVAFNLFRIEWSKSAKNFNVSFSFHTKYYDETINIKIATTKLQFSTKIVKIIIFSLILSYLAIYVDW
jgi:hypothetical protein